MTLSKRHRPRLSRSSNATGTPKPKSSRRPKSASSPSSKASEPVRLQVALAHAGVASRRKAETLITQGRVKVNGSTVRELGVKVDPAKDRVEFDGKPLRKSPEEFICLLLYKPKGVISTVSDERSRRTIMSLLPPDTPRVYPVGRLDRDTTGLLLLTNDGEIAFRLAHPSFEVHKKYRVWVRGKVRLEDLRRLEKGVQLERRERKTAPARLERLSMEEGVTCIEVVLHEGRNRQIRRMFEGLGYEVQRLKRVELAGLTLGRLKPGESRRLSTQEVTQLKKAVKL
ncbi:MAG: rRNA pseudouridine synthase [Candidatus Omnitrophica bacterium]|nr:rRNA pseudouridine synthase [Candidatus Omnitrophota bacterium]